MRKAVTDWELAVVALLISVPVPRALSEEASLPSSNLRGVVVESVEGGALEAAEIQTGDVLLTWRRLPNPSTSPEVASGELSSYFDWLELEIEQAPRGPILLTGYRDGRAKEYRLEPGLWQAQIRPTLPQDLEEIYLSGKAQLDSGDIEAATSTWSTLVDKPKGDSIENLRSWVALMIGGTWGEQGDWEKALAYHQVALSAAESLFARSTVWEAIGVARESKNELDSAEVAYKFALETREEHHPAGLAVAYDLNNLGTISWVRGDLARAKEYNLQALGIRQKLAPQSLIVTYNLNNLGLLSWRSGDLDNAKDYLLQALQTLESIAPVSITTATTLNNLGLVASERGLLDRAQDYHLRSLQIKQQLDPYSLSMASSLNNLGAIARERGALDGAHDFLYRTLLILEKRSNKNPRLATVLNNLGVVANDRGDLNRATDYFLRALEIKESADPESLIVASGLSSLASLARARGDLEVAREHYENALRIEERLAPNSLTLAVTLNNLGTVARSLGDLDTAQDYYNQALSIEERIEPEGLAVASSLNNLGDLARARGDLELARELYSRAMKIRSQVAPESLKLANVLNKLGDVAAKRGEPDNAHAYYRQAVEVLERQHARLGGSYNVQARFRDQHSDHYRDLLDLLLSEGARSEAFNIMERFRARTFMAMLAERDVVFTADVPAQLEEERRLLTARYEDTLKGLTKLNLQEHSRKIEVARAELEKLQAEAGEIEARIRFSSPQLAAIQYPQPLSVIQAQDMLDHGTLLLSFDVGKEHTSLFTFSHAEDLRVYDISLGDETLRFQVQHLLDLAKKAVPGTSTGKDYLRLFQVESEKLYKKLFGSVAEQIASSKRLLILPDGPLHALPFAALVRDTDDDGKIQYLAEWKPIHVALSASVYAELKERRSPSRSRAIDQAPIEFVAFGDPMYPQNLGAEDDKSFGQDNSGHPNEGDSTALAKAEAPEVEANSVTFASEETPRGDPVVRSVAERGIFDWPPLPYTRHEVVSIASLFPEGTTRTFLGMEALEDQLKALELNPRILHFAAHVHTDEHLPMSSFIALTIPENPGPGQDNGLLQVWEIFERIRIDADLVVLSACESGLGKELGGEGLIGLTRAFQYAGARSVIASLWSVADRTTAELMIRFYRHLRSGLPKDEALRAAQMELIRGPIEVTDENGKVTKIDASSPYYWAAFQVYGDWQ